MMTEHSPHHFVPHHSQFNTHIERPQLKQFQKSTTSHLRNLSTLADDPEKEDFAIKSKEQEVIGLHGRRKLQRGDSIRTKNTRWGTWADQKRKHIQAYEYLCHIGEAKEWIEDVLNKPIPPIVQLEEALRDGVILAEIVQTLFPDRRLKIWRGPGLTWKHTENIAIFFRLLAEFELPDPFFFELVDLYEKKNIPKVIYCIHSLSWLLWKNGVTDFRIGNLVGRLSFEDHDIEATQKSLDRAGLNLPNFSGMGASFGVQVEPEPEPEPVETEDERIERELRESEPDIIELQSQIRGAMLRIQLGETMQQLYEVEDSILALQSKVRGDMSRAVVQYRLDMAKFAINLQSAIRGFMARSKAHDASVTMENRQKDVVALQSLIRGFKHRERIRHIKVQLQKQDHGLRQFQAAVRGAFVRRDVADEYDATRDAEPAIQNLQAALRGAIMRKKVEKQTEILHSEEHKIEFLQSAVRGMLQRKVMRAQQEHMREHNTTINIVQAATRGLMVRNSIQATKDSLKSEETLITTFQSIARSFLVRNQLASTKAALRKQDSSILLLQSAVRGYTLRQQTFDQLCALNEHEDSIVSIQSMIRGMLCRSFIGTQLMELENRESQIIAFQAIARGRIVRVQFAEKMKYYKENMQKVVKIQSFIRARQQGEAYKVITSGKNPPVKTVKNFVHLLNDSDFDFDEEIEFERLRKTIVHRVRENEQAEQYIDQLDIKIALLVKNKITLDEVISHQKHFGGDVGNLLTNRNIANKDPFDLKALNKDSRKKLEHYQELFFLLQTQPQYIARLLVALRDRGLPEPERKKIGLLVMGVFGYAQKRREEYYLIRLIGKSMEEELDSCETLQDFQRGNFFWAKVLTSYVRSPRDRKYLRDLLGNLIREEIVDNDDLDLESDPIQIYRSAINNEELRTGQRSRRPADISREEAIQDPETREMFVRRLQDLGEISDRFFAILEETMQRMPYGIRFVAQQMFQSLCKKFQYESEHVLLGVVGHWVWKTYIQPATLQPDTWGVIDRGLSPIQKRNLGEVSKVVNQVATGQLFDRSNVLERLNPYVAELQPRVEEIWKQMIGITPAEEEFDINEFNDLSNTTKPTLYIKLTDIFTMHQFVVQDLPVICPKQDDMLREVLRELGSPKNNESNMLHVGPTEISLQLSAKFHDVEDPDAAIKTLFMETKRCILYLIRIQTGQNLYDIMIQPVTEEDEEKWSQLVLDELREQQTDPKKRNLYHDTSSLLDIASLTYAALKRVALQNIISLERTGRISRLNQYQELLNDIALDIRTKHRRRVQRSREIDNARATIATLEEKQTWLRSQLNSYNDYIEHAMVTLQQKAKGKKRFLLPFTKQYNHERELQRSGRVPKFGSYKYSGRTLSNKGVLVSWRGYTEHQWDRLDVTISSDEAGVFHFEGSIGSLMVQGASATLALDSLLQAQFNNMQFVTLFGAEEAQGGEGPLKLNVNLLVHLLMKKFYSQP